MSELFSIVPLAVWADKRLTLKQMRVLGVLFSFRGKNTDIVWPSRAQIAGRCGMSPCHVSTATSELERLGWLQKDGKGGHSKSTRYTITVPDLHGLETVPDSGTVPEFGTVPESGTGGVPESGTRLRVPESGTGKEQTSEQTTMANEPPVSSKAADHCPYQQIIDAYHEAMPENPRCKILSASRKAAIKARWTEAAKLTCKPFGYATRAEGLDAWRRFFEICADSDFLTGKAPGYNGRPSFVADIDFLMRPQRFAQILENKYHREAAA